MCNKGKQAAKEKEGYFRVNVCMFWVSPVVRVNELWCLVPSVFLLSFTDHPDYN